VGFVEGEISGFVSCVQSSRLMEWAGAVMGWMGWDDPVCGLPIAPSFRAVFFASFRSPSLCMCFCSCLYVCMSLVATVGLFDILE
jgi:hypothetical protein